MLASIALALVILLITYALLLLLLPKGNIFHELLHIPVYLWQINKYPVKMQVQRHRFGTHRKQYLLHCRPKAGLPIRSHAILYHHGGGWQFGKPEWFLNNAQAFTAQGYEVFMPSYRKIPFHSFWHIREDITLGLQKAMEILEMQGHTTKPFLLGGMSAGGNLAALLALDQKALQKAGIPPARIRGLLLFGAAFDLDEMPMTPTIFWYAGKRGSPSYQQANPIKFWKPDFELPLFWVHGKRDGLVSYRNVSSFLDKLNAKQQARLTLISLENGTHLDAGRWSFEDNEVRKQLHQWLKTREAE